MDACFRQSYDVQGLRPLSFAIKERPLRRVDECRDVVFFWVVTGKEWELPRFTLSGLESLHLQSIRWQRR
jgi:hypothetical protein